MQAIGAIGILVIFLLVGYVALIMSKPHSKISR